jgi:hypothetical protein
VHWTVGIYVHIGFKRTSWAFSSLGYPSPRNADTPSI